MVTSANKHSCSTTVERDDCTCPIDFLISDALNENSQLSYVAKCRHCKKLEKVKELVLEHELEELFEKIASLREQLAKWREHPHNSEMWMNGYSKALHDISQTLHNLNKQEEGV